MQFFSREMASFIEIARTRSLRQAAQSLNVSASALSRQISILEQQVGVQLMTRLPSGVRLTPKGLALLARAEDWLRQTVQLRLELGATQTAESLSFRLGIMECLGAQLMPKLWHRLGQKQSLVNCSITVGDTTGLFEQLLAGSLDAIVAFNLPRHKEVRVVQEWNYPIGLVCPPPWRPPNQRTVALRDCLSWPLLLPAPPLSCHARLHAEIERQRRDTVLRLQSNSVTVLKRLVADQQGVTFLSQLDVYDELEQGELAFIPLSERRLTERLGLCTMGGLAASRMLESVLRDICKSLTEMHQHLGLQPGK